MNKIHRIVWSATRQAYVVAAENANTHGKPSSTRRAAVAAVTSALLALGGAAADAAPTPPCNSILAANFTNAASIEGPCQLGPTFSLINTGTISAPGSGFGAVTVLTGSSVAGSITNSGASALLSGHSNGIYINGSGGSVLTSLTNSGVISGDSSYGIYVTAGSISGTLTNSGVITGLKGGIFLTNGTVISGITNSGTISNSSSREAIAFNQSTLSGNLTNSGTISGGDTGISIFSSTITGSLTNSGTISGDNIVGIIFGNGTLTGGLTNSGRISGGSSAGISLSSSLISGGLTNSGTISGASYSGIKFSWHGTLTGGLTNSGTISGRLAGIALNRSSISDGITNSGTLSRITGSTYGIHVLRSTISGSIVNQGTIGQSVGANAGTGIYLESSSITGGITNSGLINGGGNNNGNGISLNNSSLSGSSGSIVNSLNGHIYGGSNGVVVATTSFLAGGISNDGIISGDHTGVLIVSHSTVTGGLTNSGTISGGGNYGIALLSSSTITSGLTNSGTISGGTYAIFDSGTSIDSIVITGTDTAKFIGAVVAPNTPVTVAASQSYTMDNSQQFTVSGFTNAGTLKVGAGSTGTITGNFTNTGTFSPAVASMISYGKLSVTGTINLGGTLMANDVSASGLVAGTLTGVIHHGGARTGTFATVTNANNLFTWTANYGANDVNLVLSSGGSTGYLDAVVTAGQTPATGAGTALDQIAAQSNGLSPVTLKFLNVPQAGVANAVTQTLPLLVGGSQVASGAALSGLHRVVHARIERNRGLSAGDEFYGDNKLWLKPFGSWADQNERKDVPGYKANVAGMAMGVDGVASESLRLGGAFGYAKADINGNSDIAPSSAKVDVYELIGYGSYTLDKDTELNFQAGLGQNKNEGRRKLLTWGTTAKASYDSLVATVGAGLGRTYALSEATSVTPSVRADYTWVRDDGYTEKGADVLSLKVRDRTSEAFVLAVDGKVTHQLSSTLNLTGNLGVGYDFMNEKASIVAAYVGEPGVAFTTYGINPSPWIVRGGVGLSNTLASGVELSVRYDVEYREDFLNQTASVKARWAF